MSGVGITYLWVSNEFPSFVRLEGKRGDYEVYVPERTCHNVDAMFKSLWECSDCGWKCCDTYSCESAFNYCPNCGCKVVS